MGQRDVPFGRCHTAQRVMLARRMGRDNDAKKIRDYLASLCANLNAGWLIEDIDRISLHIHAVGQVM